jgi:mono/diheme cytochrome c family protein
VISGIKFFPAIVVLVSVFATTAGFAADTPADVKAGATLYRDKGCGFCHGPALQGTKKAPALADIRNDKAWPAGKMTTQILDGGQKMPPFRDALSDEEIAQLVAFLRAKDHPAPPPADPPSH